MNPPTVTNLSNCDVSKCWAIDIDPSWSLSSSSEVGIVCALVTLAANAPGELTQVWTGGGPGSATYVLTGYPDRVAMRGVFGTDANSAPLAEGTCVAIESQCTLKDPAYFEECLAKQANWNNPTSDNCILPENWFADCVPAETAQCPYPGEEPG